MSSAVQRSGPPGAHLKGHEQVVVVFPVGHKVDDKGKADGGEDALLVVGVLDCAVAAPRGAWSRGAGRRG